MRRRAVVVGLAVALTACASAPALDVRPLAGEWRGRISTVRGHTAARLTVAPDGRYEGTAFFDGVEWPLRGAILTLPSGRLRYVSSEGDGSVAVDGGVLHLRGDDGTTGAVLRRAGP